MNRKDSVRPAWRIFAAFALIPVAQAQPADDDPERVAATLSGGVDTFSPTRDSRLYLRGSAGLATHEYFRGAYDHLEEGLDQIGLTTSLSATLALPVRNGGAIRDLGLTFGTANNLASDSERPDMEDSGHWYESNWFAGMAGRLGQTWLASLTYTAYGEPADGFDPTHEIAFATQYDGDNTIGNQAPQWKVATPFEAATPEAEQGVFTSFSLTPEAELGERSVTLEFPLEIGIGLDDYHGEDSGTARYARAAVSASMPLAAVPSGLGDWRLGGELSVLARDRSLRDTEPEFANDTWVPGAEVTLSVTY